MIFRVRVTDAMAKRNLKQQLETLVGDMVAGGIRLEEALREFEIQFILQVLRDNNGNQCRAASLLGMNRGTLRKKLEFYGIGR